MQMNICNDVNDDIMIIIGMSVINVCVSFACPPFLTDKLVRELVSPRNSLTAVTGAQVIPIESLS